VLLLGFGGCLALVAVGSGGGDGDDLADLRDACAGGDMAACDDLFEESDVDSEDGFFGATCGLRTDASFAGECEASFGSVVE